MSSAAGMEPYAAVIFDFDGVIVESEHIKARAFELLYAPHGPAVVAEVVAHHLANGGISRRKKIRHCHRTLLGVDVDEATVDALCRRFSELVEDEVVACPWVPGAQDLLARLHGRTPMFVVSGTPHDELGRILSRRGLAPFFAEVHGSPPEKTPIVRGILERHRLDAETVVFIGDSAADHRAATDTGVHFLGRLAAGRESPFPPGTPTVPDLTGVAP